MNTVKILLVEDNPADIIVAKEIFNSLELDIELDVCKSSEEVDTYFARAVPLPLLILMDLNLPGETGIEILKRIKTQDKIKHIPVVMLTTSHAPHDIKEAYMNYASGYVVKANSFTQSKENLDQLVQYWLTTVSLP